MSFVLNTIKEHIVFSITMVIVFVIGIIGVVVQPVGPAIPALQNTFFLTGFSLQAVILLLSIASYLIWRYFKGKKQNLNLLIWSISYYLLSIVFIGLILRSFGISWANDTQPELFFVWRNFMILFMAGLFYGTIRLITTRKVWQIYPTVIFIVLFYIWFILSLFILPVANPIEFCMYGFLYFGLIPVCLLLSYLWFIFGRRYNLSAGYLLSLGFALFAITYAGWAPWHFPEVIYIYFIWFALFILSLVPMLLGFVVLAIEKEK